jgi:hypothetical protein
MAVVMEIEVTFLRLFLNTFTSKDYSLLPDVRKICNSGAALKD